MHILLVQGSYVELQEVAGDAGPATCPGLSLFFCSPVSFVGTYWLLYLFP